MMSLCFELVSYCRQMSYSFFLSFEFIAERKTSLGKDWHGACLKCEKCNKTLVPGQVKFLFL